MVRKLVVAFACLVVLAVAAAPAHAQATRTWVSGVGDDANPCSRTAPCKTFAGAISKTATNGEINVLDPGGFGGVTITKSITISSENFEAGVLVSGTNAIIINATATSNVVLRGLDIEGLGTGLVGVKVLGALGSLHIEKCTINNFRGTNGGGVEIGTSSVGTTKVFIQDTIIRNNGQGTGAGIFINPTGSAVVKTSLSNVQLLNNLIGLKEQGATSTVYAVDTEATGNTNAGFSALTAGCSLQIEKSTVSTNGTGVNCAASTNVRIGNTAFANNTATLAGTCTSFQNNDIDAIVAVNPQNPQ
ncbi:MAG TPA: right-handed parallel beta-helix repeat-containing protein [Thermoanaerobaculia bacterium]|nr:right-handed parallel beta-helix repeat-containing protein [Thermoanaerobaculia bacterium]